MAKKASKRDSGQDAINGTLFAPTGEWEPPEIPDISIFRRAHRIGIDIETRDPNLKTLGPGTYRNDGEIAGISLAIDDMAWYLPFAHLSGGNLSRDHVLSFMREVAKIETSWVGTNLSYELEWLGKYDINLSGKFHDVSLRESLIDEESITGYSLEAISKKYLGYGKDETLLNTAADAYGINPKSELWKLHSKYVGPYAEVDAINPLRIYDRQQSIIDAEDLNKVVDVESRVLPMMVAMRRRGILIDREKSEQVGKTLQEEQDNLRIELLKLTGFDIDPWSGVALAKMCDRLRIMYHMTAKGNPSFDDEFLRFNEHPAIQLVLKIRILDRLGSTFVRDFDKKWICPDGRIHTQFHQLKSDEDGTRSGRFSNSNPNLQQTPGSRMELRGGEWAIKFAKMVRSRFIPDPGLQWAKMDYSQQEPRLLVHFASVLNLMGSREFRDIYRDNRTTDFYKMLCDMAQIPRRLSKDLTLGRMYAMGKKKLAEKLNCDIEEASTHLRKFDQKFPFVKELSDACMTRAANRGYIRTILGRRSRFNLWEPCDTYDRRRSGENIEPLPLEQASERWSGVRLMRSMTHKALNRLIQGSAADMTKVGMLQLYEEQKVIPYMTMHDEVGTGVECREEAEKQVEVLENCLPLEVPMFVELFVGDSWGVKL